MKKLITALLCCLFLAGCASANAQQYEEGRDAKAMHTFRAVATDKPIPQVVINHSEKAQDAEPENAPESEPEPTSDEETDEQVYEPEAEYIEDYSGSGTYYAEYSELYNTDGPSRTMPGWHDGRVETYYSSNVLYHYRTGEWTVDDEGFYRTDEGYYVVGVSTGDYEIGDTFEGGKGTCIVMDYGDTSQPVTDYYTNW